MSNKEELWLEGGGMRDVYTDDYVDQLEAEIEKQRKGLRYMESVLGWNPTEEPIEMCDMALAVRDLEAENAELREQVKLWKACAGGQK